MLKPALLLMAALQLVGCPASTTPERPTRPGLPSPVDGKGGSVSQSPSQTPTPSPVVSPGARLPVMGPPVAQITREPELRIRLMSGADNIDISGNGPLILTPVGVVGAPITMNPPVSITRGKDGFILRPRSGQAMAWLVPAVTIDARDGDHITLGKTTYPHRLTLHGIGTGGNTFDVVNLTTLEEYLPGVLDKELYKSWSANAFLAQAIAARSYAIFSANRSARRHFDLESSVISQAYSGTVSNPVATSAVRQTRGLVLTWKGEVLPAYYSAATGGVGQDAVIAFADGADIPPLKGQKQGDWESACPQYRWGPITRSKPELSRRFADWGRENKDPIAGIGEIESIVVSGRNGVGRPAQFTVTDNAGRKFTLMAEEFRFACNNEAPGLPKITMAQNLKSSFVTVQVSRASVTFSDGRGFGHGVGMSQWGAQGMAAKGYDFRRILATYYPGAEVTRAYK